VFIYVDTILFYFFNGISPVIEYQRFFCWSSVNVLKPLPILRNILFFHLAAFEALLYGSWEAVELIRIMNGTMVMHFMDNQYIIEEKSPFSNLRIRSRQATLSDCTCYLRPGIDICVLSASQHAKISDEENPEPVSHLFISLFNLDFSATASTGNSDSPNVLTCCVCVCMRSCWAYIVYLYLFTYSSCVRPTDNIKPILFLQVPSYKSTFCSVVCGVVFWYPYKMHSFLLMSAMILQYRGLFYFSKLFFVDLLKLCFDNSLPLLFFVLLNIFTIRLSSKLFSFTSQLLAILCDCCKSMFLGIVTHSGARLIP
jgi:hypothetical protein